MGGKQRKWLFKPRAFANFASKFRISRADGMSSGWEVHTIILSFLYANDSLLSISQSSDVTGSFTGVMSYTLPATSGLVF